MAGLRILVTGAGGKVGSVLLSTLAEAGHTVIGTDIVRTKKIRRLPEGVELHLCDLTDAVAVAELVEAARPDAIVHTAAIVAPVAYVIPEAAKRVNVDGSLHLIAAARAEAAGTHFVFVSSFAVHGFHGPMKGAPWTGDSPLTPSDNYGVHKAVIERELAESGLSFSILRLGGVFDPHDLIPAHPCYKPFGFMIPLDQPEHGAHVADVARALAHAAELRPDGKRLMIGGDASWLHTAEEMREGALGALGLRLPRRDAYRRPPEGAGPEGWFCEGSMDTSESQSLLDYQRIPFPEMLDELRRASRLQRPLLRLLRAPVMRLIERDSPYLGPDAIEPAPALWDDLKRIFAVTDDHLRLG